MKTEQRQRRKSNRHHGQGLVEFALVLPILLMVVVGLIEASRLVFYWAIVTTASREGARLGSTLLHFNDCAGIEAAALQPGQFVGMTAANVSISYDSGPGTSAFASCGTLNPDDVDLGDRILIVTNAQYTPAAGFLPFSPITVSSTSSRTIAKGIELDGESGGSGGGTDVPPTIDITAPGNGSTHLSSDTITFEATASDTEDGSLTSAITWSSSPAGISGTGGTLNITGLTPDTYTVTATVTDSSSQTVTDTITVTFNAEVTVSITLPTQTDFDSGDTIQFQGHAVGQNGQDLSHQIDWYDNGSLFQSNSANHSAVLSDGFHTVVAEFSHAGETVTDSVALTVHVEGNSPPTVTITTPGNGATFSQGAAISFSANVSDDHDSGLGASLVWTSSISGYMGTGSTISTSSLGPGTHTITASVLDSAGANGSAAITVNVSSGPPGPPQWVEVTWVNYYGGCDQVRAYFKNNPSWAQYATQYKVLRKDAWSSTFTNVGPVASQDPNNTYVTTPTLWSGHAFTFQVSGIFPGPSESQVLQFRVQCDGSGNLTLTFP